MTNLQKIKEAVWKANPSILKLKNGCLILGGGIIWNGAMYFNYDEMTDNIDIPKEEILGRTIHLADILLAIKSTKLGPMVMIDCNGSFIGDNNVREQLITLGATWNLLEDDLDKNPQCWDFIAGLLDKN